jgi:hypothetical protein
VARRAAEELSSPGVPKQTVKLLLALELPPTSNYTKEEEQWAKDEKIIIEKGGWWKLPDQRLFVPSVLAAPLIKQHGNALGANGPGKTAGQILFHSQVPHPVQSNKC